MERLCMVYIIAMTGAITVEGLCFYPCNIQLRETYVSVIPVKGVIGKASCKHPSKIVLDGEVLECYMRSGPFVIERRSSNEYRCVKKVAVDPINGFVQVAYVKPWAHFPENPGLCDVCAVEGAWTTLKFIAKEVLGNKRYSKVKVPTVGCNVPKGCLVKNPYTDIPCTGCEPQQDDGLCCAGCNKAKTYH